ncbi:MAG: hypothetical protein ACLR5Q_00190 [Coprococcus sp.]
MISKERLRKIIYNNTIFDTSTDLNTHYDKHNASIQKDVDRAISSGKMAKAEVSPIGLTMSDTADENIENVPDNITLKYTDGTEYVIDGEDAYNTIVSLKDSGKSGMYLIGWLIQGKFSLWISKGIIVILRMKVRKITTEYIRLRNRLQKR